MLLKVLRQAGVSVARVLLLLPLSGLVAGCSVASNTARDAGTSGMTEELVAAANVSGVLEEAFTLVNGNFEGPPYVAGAASRPRVMTVPGSVTLADVDGDGQDEAAAVLLASMGGTGSFVHLILIENRNGAPETAAAAVLGDRVILKNLSIEGADIVLDTIEQGDFDPLCCPTVAWRRSFTWDGQMLRPGPASRLDYDATVAQPESSAPRRFRGEVVWGHEMRSFRECSSGREAWISLAPGADLDLTYQRLAVEPYAAIFMEVDGVWSDIPGTGFGSDFKHSMLVSQVRRAEREGFGCNEQLDGFLYRARGNEPSWRLDVREDRLEFSSMTGNLSLPDPEARIGGDSVRILAGSGDESVDLTITAGRCVDSMSGSVFAFSATLAVGNRQLNGCAINGF